MKKWVGIGVIAILLTLIAINIFKDGSNSAESDMLPTTQDSDQGAYIVSDHDRLEVGEQAPNFELETLDGEKIQLSDLQGKKIILNFWATWCPPCRQEMPEMQDFYDDYGDEVEIIALNATATESNEQDVPEFIEEFGYTYPVLLDRNGDVNDAYRIFSMPTSYFIGTDGTIQKPVHIGPMDYDFMVKTVEELS